VRSQTERQEQALQRFTTQYEKQRTDQSMNLLRPSSPDLLVERLTEIREELSLLREQRNDDDDTRLQSVLEQLQACLDQLSNGSNDKNKSIHQENNSNSILQNHDSSSPEPPASLSLETSLLIVNDADEESDDDRFGQALRRLAHENAPDALRAGAKILYLYVNNLANHPRVPRYRKIFTSNETFQKVDTLTGGRDLLLAVGFTDSTTGNCLEWYIPEEEETGCLELLKTAAAALKVLQSSSPPVLPEMRAATPHRSATKQPSHKTPDLGSVVSPPMTKKQIFPSEDSEFPPMHPLRTDTHSREAPSTLLQAEMLIDAHSPIRGERIHEETDAV
jgi:hypothetical protein